MREKFDLGRGGTCSPNRSYPGSRTFPGIVEILEFIYLDRKFMCKPWRIEALSKGINVH